MRFFLHLTLIILAGLIQISLINLYQIQLNLILVLVIFMSFVGMPENFWWAFFGGIFLDIYSVHPFGVFTLSLLIVAIVSQVLSKQVFTNRRFLPFLTTGICGILIFQLFLLASNQLLFLLRAANLHLIPNKIYWTYLFWQILSGSIFLALIFFIARFISRKLRKIFIFKEETIQI